MNIELISSHALQFLGKTYRCAIGENGVTDTPQEGAKKTPIGSFALRECWYRADRLSAPATPLLLRVVKQSDGWCDAPSHPDYNQHVTLPFPASHEQLWREDHTYDIIVPLGFNDENIVPGKGSAIFFHLAKPGYSPTLGCIALALPDMLEILAKVNKETRMVIK